MRRLVLVTVVALLLASPVSAHWFGVRWHPTPPVTTVALVDETSDPALSELVRQVAARWSDTTSVLRLDYRHVGPGCNPRNGELWVCGEDLPGAAASWTQFWLNGKDRTNIRKALVTLNTASLFSPANVANPDLEPTLRYLVCHETGGGLGLAEGSWSDPDHRGCMNLVYQSPYPSIDDAATLTSVYGG